MGKRGRSLGHEIAECDMWLSTSKKKPKTTASMKLSTLNWPSKKPAAFVKQTTLMNYFSNQIKHDGTSKGSFNPDIQPTTVNVDYKPDKGEIAEIWRGEFPAECAVKEELRSTTAEHDTGRSLSTSLSPALTTPEVREIHPGSLLLERLEDQRDSDAVSRHRATDPNPRFPSLVLGMSDNDARRVRDPNWVEPLSCATVLESLVQDSMGEKFYEVSTRANKRSIDLGDAFDTCVADTLQYQAGETLSSSVAESLDDLSCPQTSTCCVVGDTLEEASCEKSLSEHLENDIVIPDSLVEATCLPVNDDKTTSNASREPTSHRHKRDFVCDKEALWVGRVPSTDSSASQHSYSLDSVDSLTDRVQLSNTQKLDMFEMELELMKRCPSSDARLTSSEQTLL